MVGGSSELGTCSPYVTRALRNVSSIANAIVLFALAVHTAVGCGWQLFR